MSSAPIPLSASPQADDIFTAVSANEPADTLDPSLAYSRRSLETVQQIYEPLLLVNKETNAYVPHLAARWDVSSAQDIYTLYPRRGVTFHDGGTLEPHDIAYSIQRGLLQSEGSSLILTNAIMGYWNITEQIGGGPYNDRASLLANADADEMRAVCEEVRQRVQADDAAGTVTINLVAGSSVFLTELATYGYVLDMEWTVAQGDWDGSCDTWQNFFYPGSTAEGSKLDKIANGSGPFKLQNWSEGDQMVLARHEDYWIDPAPLSQIVLKRVEDAGQRQQMLLNGQADYAQLEGVDLQQYVLLDYSGGNVTLLNPSGVLKSYRSNPLPSATDIFFTFDIETENNPYIGNGVSSDFFADVNVRKAFSHAFDYEAFKNQVFNGQAIRRTGPIAANLMGYSPDQPTYDYDPVQAKQELAQALGGSGFSMTFVYYEGNLKRQKAVEILAQGIEALDAKYQIDVVLLPFNDVRQAWNEGKLPLASSGWNADYASPLNWLGPYLFSFFADQSRMPQTLQDDYEAQTYACMAMAGEAQRDCLEAIQEDTHERALQLYLFQETSSDYVRAEVRGYEEAMAYHDYPYYYVLSKGPVPVTTGWSPGNTAEIQVDAASTPVTIEVPQSAFDTAVDIVTGDSADVSNMPTTGYAITNAAFTLSVFDETGGALSDQAWTGSLNVTVGAASQKKVNNVGDRHLLRWNGGHWVDDTCGDYVFNGSTFTVPICKSGLYTVGVETVTGFMPLLSAP